MEQTQILSINIFYTFEELICLNDLIFVIKIWEDDFFSFFNTKKYIKTLLISKKL